MTIKVVAAIANVMTEDSWRKRMINTLKGEKSDAFPPHKKDRHALVAEYIKRYGNAKDTILLLGDKHKNSIFVKHAVVINDKGDIVADMLLNSGNAKFVDNKGTKNDFYISREGKTPVWLKIIKRIELGAFLKENELDSILEREEDNKDKKDA
ncbi:hypothetical protein GR11A_00029 [Vibrio phage vB_VcorM_GR11A]|nr:hypothetical protein GR11A_00029 [Vibrio phage vB_VcorM_GR11A]